MVARSETPGRYRAKRGARLEGPVQDRFSALDVELATLRRSGLISALREARKPSDEEMADAKKISGRVEAALKDVNIELYALVRCISPTQKSTEATQKNLCE
jgi:hypothetical protein